ncbi:MAG: hypothetical protein MJY97_04160 [Bacteroidales bacterium]|nr:hypothetical protein [Bacteroidales bacterium]
MSNSVCKLVRTILYMSLVVSSVSCSGISDAFVLDENVLIDSFPATVQVKEPDIVPINVVGVQGIKLVENYILLSVRDSIGCLIPYTKDGSALSSPLLKIGRGPGEVLYQPFMSWICIQGGEAGLYDWKGNYLIIDLDASVESDALVWNYMFENLPMEQGSRYYFIAEGQSLLCRRIKSDNSGYERCIIGNQISTNHSIDILNNFSAVDANILSTEIVLDGKGRVAEFGSRMNVVHFYSLFGNDSKTAIIGKKKESIQKMGMIDETEMRKIYYDAKPFDSFVAGLYLGATFDELDRGMLPFAEVHLFSWNGAPIAKITLPEPALYFDIDIEERQLYVVNYHTEELHRYDITELFSK